MSKEKNNNIKTTEDEKDYTAREKGPEKLTKGALIYDTERRDDIGGKEASKLSSADKFSYFKEYQLPYLLITVGIIALLLASFKYFSHTRDTNKTFTCSMTNDIRYSDRDSSDVRKGFVNYLEETRPDTKINDMDIYLFSDSFINEFKFTNLFNNQEFDAIVCNDTTFKSLVSENYAMDLRAVLDFTQLADFESQIVYVLDEDGDSIPYGILLENTTKDFIIANEYNDDGTAVTTVPIYIVCSNTTKISEAADFLEYLYK